LASAIYAKQPAAGGIGGLFDQILRRGCLALEVSLRSVILCAALPVLLSAIAFVVLFRQACGVRLGHLAVAGLSAMTTPQNGTFGRGEHKRGCRGAGHPPVLHLSRV
jgi:hypothetical protein